MDKQVILTQQIATGLLLTLSFTLALIALGYSIFLSLLLGLVGAGSGVFIVSWWYDDTAIPAPDGEAAAPGLMRQRRKKSNAPGVEEAQSKRLAKETARQERRRQSRGSGTNQTLISSLLQSIRWPFR